MTARSFVPIFVALLGAVLLAGCSGMKGQPLGGHYELEGNFRRLAEEDRFGVRVSADLESGTMSDEQVEALSTFISNLLRESRPGGVVLDLTSYESQSKSVDLVLDIVVTKFAPADAQARSQGIRSHLAGRLTMLDTANEPRGAALIRADGFRLDVLKETKAPDTVVYFTNVIVDLIN
jgi:hypothetical protein